MKKYGVIGYPLSHSLSPHMHNGAFKTLAIDAIYEKYQISPEEFNVSIKRLKKGNFAGLNVTIPYKSRIIEYLDDIDPDAEAVGAVNTVIKKNHIWKGYNTDIAGFISPLLKIKQKISKCLLLGSGGASRAVIYSLGKYLKPEQIIIAGRNQAKAEKLCSHLQILVNPTRLGYLQLDKVSGESIDYDLIVNATPLGTFPAVKESPIPGLKHLKPGAIVYDLVYNPKETRLLRDAQKIGVEVITINGLEMLLKQAAHSFKIWTGREMPLGVVRESLLTALKN